MTDIVSQKWTLYESNVQQYRVLSATVQAFLLAVGSIWFSNTTGHSVLLTLIFIFGLLHIFWIWMPIVHARIKIVDYYKGQLALTQDQQERLALECSESQYVKDKSKRMLVATNYFNNDNSDFRTHLRTTRFKLDVMVPCGFAAIWVAMYTSKLLDWFPQ